MDKIAITLPDHGPMLEEVGRGIQIFASLEMALNMCFASLLEPADRRRSIAAINAARSFEAKIKMIDAVAAHLDEPYRSQWRSLSSKIGRRKDIRDKLAHWTVGYYPGAKSAADIKKWKVALVPPIWHQQYNDVMWSPQDKRTVQPISIGQLQEFRVKVAELVGQLVAFCDSIAPKNDDT